MKKILIITVFKSLNYGSYLQAKNLFELCSKKGKVKFLDDGQRKIIVPFIRKIIKSIKNNRFDLKYIFFEFLEMIYLSLNWYKLPHTKKFDCDLAIYGSDEIWNVSRKSCKLNIFYGSKIEARKISYAASVNTSSIKDFKKNKELCNLISTFDQISVRDKHSSNVVHSIVKKKPYLTLDPTMLLKNRNKKSLKRKEYIAIYLFEENLTINDINCIKAFALNKNMEIFSAGIYISWADKSFHSIDSNPFYIFNNAKYVITNTFHGTVFSILYNKKFIAFDRSNKIHELLIEFGLQDRGIKNPKKIFKIADENINYKTIRGILNFKKVNSIKYINNCIN